MAASDATSAVYWSAPALLKITILMATSNPLHLPAGGSHDMSAVLRALACVCYVLHTVE